MIARVSIVTISFNQAMFLEEAMLSVLGQQGVELEYIVVDPGSTDGSRDIIGKYASGLSHVILEPDDGPADGLNKGFSLATGSVFGFLNSDDRLLPGVLAKVARYFENHPGVDVVSGHGYVVDDNDRVVRKAFSHKFDLARYCTQGTALLQQSTFFRAQAFRRTRGFNVENRTCWDGELWVDLALAGSRFGLYHDYWSCFRIHEDSISGRGTADIQARYLTDSLRILGRLGAPERRSRSSHSSVLLNWLREPRTLGAKLADSWLRTVGLGRKFAPNDLGISRDNLEAVTRR